MFAGFRAIDVSLDDASIHAQVGGEGPPLLLLHGYPQTHVMWHGIAEDLAKTHTVIAADLRGYGASRAYTSDFTFRAMAADQVALMRHLGFERFHVVAHDRGARTAHRMVLDHPTTVLSVALMDILPTLDVWRTMDDWLAQRYWHWMFLAQQNDLPARLIGSDPALFVRTTLAGLSGLDDLFHPQAMAAYIDAAQEPSVIAAWCGDYQAAANVDLDHDRADLGRQSEIPTLVLWGTRGVLERHVNPLETWRTWFPNAKGQGVDAGHFLVEECPEHILPFVSVHLAAL